MRNLHFGCLALAGAGLAAGGVLANGGATGTGGAAFIETPGAGKDVRGSAGTAPNAEAHATMPKRSGGGIPRRDLVELLLDPQLSSMAPDEAMDRFAPLRLKRHEPLPDSLELVARTDSALVTFGYFRTEGRFWFTHARLELPAETPEGAEGSYQELVARVRDKLGTPHLVKEELPYRGQAFMLSSELDAVVGAVMTSDGVNPHTVLSVVRPEAR